MPTQPKKMNRLRSGWCASLEQRRLLSAVVAPLASSAEPASVEQTAEELEPTVDSPIDESTATSADPTPVASPSADQDDDSSSRLLQPVPADDGETIAEEQAEPPEVDNVDDEDSALEPENDDSSDVGDDNGKALGKRVAVEAESEDAGSSASLVVELPAFSRVASVVANEAEDLPSLKSAQNLSAHKLLKKVSSSVATALQDDPSTSEGEQKAGKNKKSKNKNTNSNLSESLDSFDRGGQHDTVSQTRQAVVDEPKPNSALENEGGTDWSPSPLVDPNTVVAMPVASDASHPANADDPEFAEDRLCPDQAVAVGPQRAMPSTASQCDTAKAAPTLIEANTSLPSLVQDANHNRSMETSSSSELRCTPHKSQTRDTRMDVEPAVTSGTAEHSTSQSSPMVLAHTSAGNVNPLLLSAQSGEDHHHSSDQTSQRSSVPAHEERIASRDLHSPYHRQQNHQEHGLRALSSTELAHTATLPHSAGIAGVSALGNRPDAKADAPIQTMAAGLAPTADDDLQTSDSASVVGETAMDTVGLYLLGRHFQKKSKRLTTDGSRSNNAREDD